jgi:hypothetical protein
MKKRESMNSWVQVWIELMKNWFVVHGNDLIDAMSGAFVYFIYGVGFKKQAWKRGLLSFVVGVFFAMYVAPQVSLFFPLLNRNFVVFCVGLLGMRMVETLFDIDFKAIVSTIINKWINK